MIKSKIYFELENPKLIKEVLKEEERQRSKSKIKVQDGKLILDIEARDFVALKATIVQYLKLIETALNAMKVR